MVVAFRLALACLALTASLAAAQQRNLDVRGEAAERRVALVIGNGAYAEGPLANPANDAADMAKALEGAGFKVILRRNANTREMRQAIREFGAELRRADVGLFYFAGHGVQARGTNYLIPIGADIQNEADVEDLAIDANYALRQMEDAQTKVNIVILDACRNNPYTRGFRSATRGLAQMTAATGSVIAFATAPGSVAADGSGRNGVYTKNLLASLQQQDTDILRVFQRTRAGVVKETGGRQVPWESTSLIGDFYFKPLAAPVATPVAVTPAAAVAVAPAAPVPAPAAAKPVPQVVAVAAPPAGGSPPSVATRLSVVAPPSTPGTCTIRRLSFSDGTQACFEEFEFFRIKDSNGQALTDVFAGRATFAYAIPAPGSNCVPSAGWAWNWNTPEADDLRASFRCEQYGTKKEALGSCKCAAIVPSSGRVNMGQREFLESLMKYAHDLAAKRRLEDPARTTEINDALRYLDERAQEHYRRIEARR